MKLAENKFEHTVGAILAGHKINEKAQGTDFEAPTMCLLVLLASYLF